MRFFPLQEGIYNPTVTNNWPREVPPKRKPYSITDKGNYGAVTTKWRPEYKQTLVETEFDLNKSTWMLYDFRTYPILGLYSYYGTVNFCLEERDYKLQPEDLLVIDSLNRPALFCFPKGRYQLFLFPYLGINAHKDILYMKATCEGIQTIKNVMQTKNQSICNTHN